MDPLESSPTLRAVAAAAGVSPATASRILAERGDFAPATRARVLDAAESLGYHRAWTRQGRPDSGSTAVELVVGRISGGWTDRVVNGAWRTAAKLGLDLTFTMERFDIEDDWLERVTRRRSLGVILGLVQPTHAQLDRLRAARLPVVLLGPLSDPPSDVRSVGTTDWAGGFAAGEHLASLGIDRFILVLGRPAYQFGRAREAGFQAAIERHVSGTEVAVVAPGWDDTGPLDAVTATLAASPSRVGIFASNDNIALRCYESADVARAQVGRDVLIVGFDDEPRAASADPPLTTLHQPIEAMAGRAVEVLAEVKHLGGSLALAHDDLPTQLVVRASTRGA